MSQVVIGMSGHIDHGKTSIIKSLTGTDTERHSEEIKRGMTIDIGFAFFSETITIIDVPGHEKFVKNMMAGSSGIDIAILVIAADDGVMPQTREHLEILKLLKIKFGLIVLNKIDLVDNDWIELVISDIKEIVKGSFFENSDIIKVSAISDIGIDTLHDEIINISKLVKKRTSDGLFRMPIDRVFTMKGFGTIVTGTVASGKIKTNQNIEILPGNKKVKIRGMQTHLNSVNEVKIGNRAALNLQNVSLDEVRRGSHIVESNYFNLVNKIGAFIQVLSSSKFEIYQNQRVRIHIGTNEVMARISLTNHKFLKPGQYGPALVKFEEPIVASYEDRFIIRLFSPIITIGGGEIVDIDIKGKWMDIKSHLNGLFNNTKNDIIYALISKYKINPLKKIDMSRLFNLSNKQINVFLDNSSKIVEIIYKNYNWVLTKWQIDNNKEIVISIIKDFHNRNKYRAGISKEEISQLIKSNSDFIDFLLDELIKERKIDNSNNVISIFGFTINLSNAEIEIKSKLFNILDAENFSSSDYSNLAQKLNEDPERVKLLLAILEEDKQIIRLDGNLMFTQDNFILLKDDIFNFFSRSDSLSINQFKDIADTSRKYAIPLLEYFDKLKITYRDNNCRRLYNHD